MPPGPRCVRRADAPGAHGDTLSGFAVVDADRPGGPPCACPDLHAAAPCSTGVGEDDKGAGIADSLIRSKRQGARLFMPSCLVQLLLSLQG